MNRHDIVLSDPASRAVKHDCSWCGLRVSAGLFQGSECCMECREGGRTFRVRMSMGRWKRAAEAKKEQG